ncbi:PREDICTED: zinc finger protein 800 [Nicrophorus vespilloides]|uniref:Zinc finger protein 800 n=1 Tax=Nicrophorus vespilloides TaxID=110193 RepID=A0ABM1NK33_NICVS|nr:PREDICTED: zinc finger protein 800 [Nicrophorus vespilloides]
MSSNKSKYKAKKQLQTTLGKAPKKYTSVDISHLRKPIDTSVIGLRQVLHLFETATNEVRNYITYECDVLYECKTCRTIYRSLANFILHKRDYCKDSCRKPTDESDEPPADVMGNSAINLCDDGDMLKFDGDKSRLNAVLSRLRKRQESQEIFDEVSGKDFSSENVVEDREELAKKGAIALEEINGNLSCVFQTLINNVPKDNQEFRINEAMEIHSILNNDEVILGPDGKALSRPDIEGFDFGCEVCKQNFATKKSLIHHVKCKHNNSKEMYLCPEYGCKGNYFPTTYSVFRHLHKVHRKSPMQYKRLRSQIQRNTIKNTTLSNYKDQILIREERNLAKFEEVDLLDSSQVCTRCGKKFERKAALQSHMQLCKTLTSLQQSGKEVKVTEKLRGSQKRKQSFNQIKSIKKGKPSVEPEKSTTTDAKDEEDSSDDVVFVQTDVVEPETIILDEVDETPPVAVAAESDDVEMVMESSGTATTAASTGGEDPLVCEEVVLESDTEEDRGQQQVTLEGKAAPYIDLSQFRCTTCECNFKHQSGLMQHMATHFKWFKYQCHICLFKSYNRSTCEDHVKSYHKSNNSKNVVTELPIEETIRISTDFQALSYAPVEKFIIKTKNATTQICKSNRHPRKSSCEEKDEEKTSSSNGVVKEAWKVIESKTSNGLVLKLKAASNGEKSASPASPHPSSPSPSAATPEEQQQTAPTKPAENEQQSEENNMHKMIMEVIFGPEMSSRPIRNRVTSKKNDFIYYEKP